VVQPDTPTVYTVVASDNFGCTRTQQVNIDIWYPFDLEPNVLRDTSVCIGTSVPFDLRATGKLITWTPATGLSNATIPNPVATPLSSTTYVATVSDSGQCFVRTASATIRVNPLPQVDLGPDLVLPFDAPFTLSPIYGPDITAYRWLPANRLNCSTCPTPSGKAEVSTTFTLIATTSQGCSQSFRINLTIDCSKDNLLMPSGFTPNSDGLNDVFYPLTRGMRIINRFLIYNRYGQLVYERKNFPPNDKNYGWDGKFGGNPQPVGSYVYIVEAECDLGQTLSAKGSISILR
jgi:gliding motility-associated-like protein